MGLFRLLFLVALLFAAVWLWRRYISAPKRSQKKTPKAEKPALMVRCEQCGVHVPQTQALPHQQRWYCCTSHLEQGRLNGDN